LGLALPDFDAPTDRRVPGLPRARSFGKLLIDVEEDPALPSGPGRGPRPG
jgi:hypothetical protein